MKNKPNRGSGRQLPAFVIAMGFLLGLVPIGYGSIMLLLRPHGIGPCRINCSLEQGLLSMLGQPLYNLVFGMTWVSAGLLLIVVLLVARRRS